MFAVIRDRRKKGRDSDFFRHNFKPGGQLVCNELSGEWYPSWFSPLSLVRTLHYDRTTRSNHQPSIVILPSRNRYGTATIPILSWEYPSSHRSKLTERVSSLKGISSHLLHSPFRTCSSCYRALHSSFAFVSTNPVTLCEAPIIVRVRDSSSSRARWK